MFSAKDLRPMLATLPAQTPSLTDKAYVYEPKVDGIRAIVEVLPGSPKASVRFWVPQRQREDAAVPGHRRRDRHVAREDQGAGRPRRRDRRARRGDASRGFQRLQHRIHVTVPGFNSKKQILPPDEQPAAFIAFDLLREGDDDLRSLVLTIGASGLEALFKKHKPRHPIWFG
jgi:ATP-dependent DNA ligase